MDIPRTMHLFAGAGGGILADILLGHRPVCAVEIEPYCRKVLLQRQRDNILPRFPIWDDVCTFDGKPWRGRVNVVCGGFPCQDISAAGKGEGITGARSGLWGEMARICGEVRPRYILVENSPMLTSRGLGRVLGDLAKMGYDAQWGVLGADAAGLAHHRARLWLVANTNRYRLQGRNPQRASINGSEEHTAPLDGTEIRAPRVPTPRILRRTNELAHTVDRLKAIGNGQVPAVAALAWQILTAGDNA